MIRGELAVSAAAVFAEKPEVVALNKVDALGPEDGEALLDLFEEAHGFRPHLISGVAGSGMDGFVARTAPPCGAVPAPPAAEAGGP